MELPPIISIVRRAPQPSSHIGVESKVLPAILGQEMAAPIFWAPGISLVLSARKPSMRTIPIKFLL